MDYVVQFVYLAIAAGTGWIVGFQTGAFASKAKAQQAKQDYLRSANEAISNLQGFVDEMDQFAAEVNERKLRHQIDTSTRSRAGE